MQEASGGRGGLKTPAVGSEAPDFELFDSAGVARSLTALVANGRRVLLFYRGHW